jgi:hypothetical protein
MISNTKLYIPGGWFCAAPGSLTWAEAAQRQIAAYTDFREFPGHR